MEMQRLGALLLDLYRYARELTIAEFQDRALRRLQDALPFDKAWWGMARTFPGQDPELHSSFPFNLPSEYADAWEEIKGGDVLAKAVIRDPGISIYLDRERMRGTGVERLSAQFGFTQAMSTLIANPDLNLITFLSVYRDAPQPVFGEDERLFMQCAMPHLVATWNTNWISQLEHTRVHSSLTRAAVAIADRHGVLLTAEPGFLELARLEWPQWKGPALPPALAAILRTQARHVGAATLCHSHPVADLRLVEVRVRSVLDRLSLRERTIATSFAEGRSYKEIAESLGLSPATVRHHLRHVYAKLSVSDKVTLSRLLAASGAPPASAA